MSLWLLPWPRGSKSAISPSKPLTLLKIPRSPQTPKLSACSLRQGYLPRELSLAWATNRVSLPWSHSLLEHHDINCHGPSQEEQRQMPYINRHSLHERPMAQSANKLKIRFDSTAGKWGKDCVITYSLCSFGCMSRAWQLCFLLRHSWCGFCRARSVIALN